MTSMEEDEQLQELEVKGVMEKIFEYLDPQDILVARLVCKSFSQVIDKKPELLWKTLRLLIANDKPSSRLNFQRFLRLSQLDCPNYHFREVELVATSDFIKSKQLVIKHLKLTYANYSVPNLYNILMSCPSLEYLELVGLPMERTSPKDKWPLYRKHPVISMNCLKVLVLKANKSSTSSKSANLSPGLLASITNQAVLLASVQISGFGDWTCENLIQILAYEPHMSNIKELVLEDIGKRNGPNSNMLRGKGFLSVLKQLDDIQLRRLVIAFIKNPYLKAKDNVSHEMSEVLETHGDYLEELEIVNCPLSEEIFQMTMPNLKKLTLDVLPLKQSRMQLKIKQFLPNLQYLQIKNSYSAYLTSLKEAMKLSSSSQSHLQDDGYIGYMQGFQNASTFKPPERLKLYSFLLQIVLILFLIQMISYIFPAGWREQIVILGHVGVVFTHLLYKHQQWQKRK